MKVPTKSELYARIEYLEAIVTDLYEENVQRAELNEIAYHREEILVRQSEMLANAVVRLREELAKYKEAACGTHH